MTKRRGRRRVKIEDAYYCGKYHFRIVQKLRMCREEADELCQPCKYKEISDQSGSSPRRR